MTTEKSEMTRLLDHLQNLIREGFEKKHFEFTVSFVPQTKEKTRVRVTGGPSRQFVLRQDEIHE
jgi:hypothetical protein